MANAVADMPGQWASTPASRWRRDARRGGLRRVRGFLGCILGVEKRRFGVLAGA